jgi:hypothetical protein
VIRRTWTGLRTALRTHPRTFVLVTAAMLALHVLVPPSVLSVTRQRADYFAVNPWLRNLPAFLLSGEVSLGRKLEVLPGLALFWISSSNAYGVEWGFSVDVSDLARFVVTSALLGAYFTLVRLRRSRPAPAWRVPATRGGFLGGLVTVCGLSTGPCSVMGCGAPVLPVVGLALAGLSSTTLKVLHDLSSVVTAIVLVGLTAGVGSLAWRTGGTIDAREASATRPRGPGPR